MRVGIFLLGCESGSGGYVGRYGRECAVMRATVMYD
jgi:hypothetical protein